MATLFMLCGLPCSGKSTLARELEAEHGALRLSADEWISRLGLDPRGEDLRAEIERIQVEIAARVLANSCDVIMETGFWRREERDRGRAVARAAGADCKLIFLDAPIEELRRRAAIRNAALPPHTFPIEEGELEAWTAQFERPAADELD